MRPQNHKKEKYTKNETDHEEPLITDNPLIKEPSYFNIFECGKNLLNGLDMTCEKACKEKPRDKYYTEMLRTITDYN